MSNDHQEAYADFPVPILYGAIAISLIVTIILSVFVFGMGGH